MTQVVEQLVAAFEALPEPERQELIAELLRRARTAPHDLPTDEDLVAAADAVFRDLDQREQVR
jgi:hypothetical protein